MNLFKKPYEQGTLEAWAKMADDIAKVAILAAPVVLYGQSGWAAKLANIVLLVFIAYLFLLGGRFCRKIIQQQGEQL